jgi:DNA ligase-1
MNVLLAATVDPKKDPNVFSKLTYPILLSPKLDGIRNHVEESICLSRKNLPLPNKHVQALFKEHEKFDGEVIVGDATDGDIVYNRTQSGVMSIEGEPDAYFWVFDTTIPELRLKPFVERFKFVETYVANSSDTRLRLVPHKLVHNLEELLAFEEEMLEMGFEGICGRSPEGIYKEGRSTLKQGILWKLKRFQDDEGIVVGFVEQMTNLNEAVIDETGHTKRSHKAEGKVPAGTLGKFLVQFGSLTIEVACGVLKHDTRKMIWNNKEKYLGKMLKFRHFPHGAKDKPRHPRFVGWRTEIDL